VRKGVRSEEKAEVVWNKRQGYGKDGKYGKAQEERGDAYDRDREASSLCQRKQGTFDARAHASAKPWPGKCRYDCCESQDEFD